MQTSRWAIFLGAPVAAWGVGYYVVVLVMAIGGTTERWEDSAGLSLAMLLVTGWGALFSLWLTWLELFVIHAICQWCVGSATIAIALFVVSLLDWRETRRLAA